jgi:hypothetical protein
MKTVLILGIVMIAIGAAVLGRYSYTTQDSILQIGPIKATAEQTHVVSLPPVLGWALIGGGVCVLVFGAWSRKT